MRFSFPLSVTFLVLLLCLPNLTFAQSENKAAYGILIDNTGSLRHQIGNTQTLGNAIAQRVSQRGFTSIFNFKTQSENQLAVVTSGAGWSQDKQTLEQYIYSLKPAPGQTALFDAIRSIGTTTNAKAVAEKLPERIIILITDGEDRVSEVKEKQLIKELKEIGVKVYAVGLVQDLESDGGFTQDSPRMKATSFLKRITKETGGNSIFPKLKKDTKVEDLLTELFTDSDKNKGH
jgi:phosphopentomutase